MATYARNPFVTPEANSMADALRRIEADHSLELQVRTDLCAAIRRLGRLLNMPLDAIPADLGFIRRRLAKTDAAKIGVTKSTLANTKSQIMRAFRHLGLKVTAASYMAPLTPAWRSLYDRLPTPYVSWGLSRFMHFCSANDIDPSGVTQAVFDRFKCALEEESLVAHPVQDHQTACRLWNKMQKSMVDWPDVVIEVPRYQVSYAVSWDCLDPSLVREIRSYLDALAKPDPLDPKAPTRPFRRASLRAAEGNLKRYLGALRAASIDIGKITTLAELVDFEHFRIGIRWLWDRNGGKTSKHIGEIAWTIRCVAVKHLGVDEATAARFADAMRSLRIIDPGLSQKNHRLLAEFDSMELAKKFLRLPLELWQKAEREKERIGSYRAALMVETAIAIELLIFAPMRSFNLINLDIARHLNWQRDRSGERLHIHIDAAEVKNAQRLEFVLPPATSKRVRIFINEWRPMIGGKGSTALFPGRRRSGAKDQSCLSRQITRAVREAIGVTVTPHQFRHIAAKLFLDQRPGAYEVVRRLLGHKSLTTTYQHYAGAETKAAVEHYDDEILKLSGAEAKDAPRRSLKKLLAADLALESRRKFRGRR